MNFPQSLKFTILLQAPLIFILAIGLNSVMAQKELTVEIIFNGLEAELESEIFIAVYDKKDQFLSDFPYTTFVTKTNGKSEFAYSITLPEGTYALAFFQDLNKNKKLDKNLVGYPKEPFSFSNNAPVVFGPPKWRDAVFKLAKPETMNINF